MKANYSEPALKKSCLVLSHGPVPTPEHPVVEGGGLRSWGLAKGLKANSPNLQVTVAYHQGYKKEAFTDSHESIQIATWSNDNLHELIQAYDTVVVSYCMGDLSMIVAHTIRPDQQLVLDCYVPIYIEVSARQSKNIEEEYHAFNTDVSRWASVLKRGDLFLCASEPQKRYYQGVLSGLGRINPANYGTDSILIVPYGIYRERPVAKQKPISALVKDHNYRKVLWFGGIYPWFDLRKIVTAIEIVNRTIPTKLIIVGAKNPYNTHKDFVARYEELTEYIQSNPHLQSNTILQDWVNFEDRADWYLDSDCVIVVNKQGAENELAWRTRLVDFMWADLPIITNGGDPLGEKLIAAEAAFRLRADDEKTIAADIAAVLDAKENATLSKNLATLRKTLYWDKVTQRLTKAIMTHERAKDLIKFGLFDASSEQPQTVVNGKLRRIIKKSRKVPAYAKKYGYRATANVIGELVRRKVLAGSSVPLSRKPSYVFVSHQLDMSGAPFIAIDMAIEFKEAGKNVQFFTYLPAHHDNLSKLNRAGIKPHALMNKDMVPGIIPGDTVILNTVAHSETVKEAIFSMAEQKVINQIIWYLHEDDPELLFRADEQRRIKKMLQNGQMKILIAADKMLQNYIAYFGTKKNIVKQTYRHIVPQKYHRQLSEQDFSKKLTFVLPGTMGDGRKGQLPIFYAFNQFYHQYYLKNKNAYRDFELILVGISTDFLSRQLLNHVASLKDHFSYYERVSWIENLAIVAKSNMTICYSLRECLPLFVFEGMISGHPILRNDSSGMAEQLQPGKNGFYLESKGYEQVVEVIEKVLNKSKTSDKQLAAMSRQSYKIAEKQEHNSYLDFLRHE